MRFSLGFGRFIDFGRYDRSIGGNSLMLDVCLSWDVIIKSDWFNVLIPIIVVVIEFVFFHSFEDSFDLFVKAFELIYL